MAILTFLFEQTKFGMDVSNIREIVLYPKEVSRLPLAPKHVHGVHTVRGQVITLIKGEKDNPKLAVIFDYKGKLFGLGVNAVEDVISQDSFESERVMDHDVFRKNNEMYVLVKEISEVIKDFPSLEKMVA